MSTSKYHFDLRYGGLAALFGGGSGKTFQQFIFRIIPLIFSINNFKEEGGGVQWVGLLGLIQFF